MSAYNRAYYPGQDDNRAYYPGQDEMRSSRGSSGRGYSGEVNGRGHAYVVGDELQRDNSNKNYNRAKKAAKQLRKADKDGSPEAAGTVEAPPDGGLSAWAVCAGSAVLSSANAVVNVSLHETIASVNEYFNNTSNSYAESCINKLKSQIPEDLSRFKGGYLDSCSQEAIRDGMPSFYTCLKSKGFHQTFIKWAHLYEVSICNYGSLKTSQIYTNCSREAGNQPFDQGGCSILVRCYYTALGYTTDVVNSFVGNTCITNDGPNATDKIPLVPVPLALSAGSDLFSASIEEDNDDVGTTMNFIFLCVSLFCILLGGIISVFAGYRIVGIIGSALVAIGFIVASFIGDDQELVVKILVGGVGGVGSAFLRVAAIVAVLEYFEELRMRAIVLSGLGAVLINFLMLGLTFVDGIDFDWHLTFRLQAIPAGISFIASLFMKPLELKSGSSRRSGDSCSTKCSDYVFSRELFTNIILYLVMAVFLLDQLGRPIFSEGMQPIMREKQFTETQVDIQPFIEHGGSLLGLLLLLVSWKRHNLADNLTVMAAMDILIGILALHVPEMTSFAWAAAYSAIFGFTDGVFASVLQDAIPEGFCRRHIRMVAGILGFVAGAGTVAAGFIGDALDKRSNGSHESYYFSGGCLLAAGVLAIISRIVFLRRQNNEDSDSEFDDANNRRI